LNFNTFTFIYEGFRVLSAAFVQILLLATMCHTSTLNSWYVLEHEPVRQVAQLFLTYIPLH